MDFGDSAALLGLRGGSFITRLEKHLDDHKRGRGYMSKGTASEIQRQHIGNRALVPNDSSLYSTYSTFLNYGSKAYFAHAVHDARKTSEFIQGAPERAEAATEELKRSLGYA